MGVNNATKIKFIEKSLTLESFQVLDIGKKIDVQ